MQYIIMIAIVVGMAATDFVTGIIKGYATSTLSSKIMRKGGLNKLAEIIIMSAICGLEIGLDLLGRYYGERANEITAVLGAVTAGGTFVYIVLMELLSMLENYAVINPNATWAKKLIQRLKNTQENKEEKK